MTQDQESQRARQERLIREAHYRAFQQQTGVDMRDEEKYHEWEERRAASIRDELELSREEVELILGALAYSLRVSYDPAQDEIYQKIWMEHGEYQERLYSFHYEQEPKAERYVLIKVTEEEGSTHADR